MCYILKKAPGNCSLQSETCRSRNNVTVTPALRHFIRRNTDMCQLKKLHCRLNRRPRRRVPKPSYLQSAFVYNCTGRKNTVVGKSIDILTRDGLYA